MAINFREDSCKFGKQAELAEECCICVFTGYEFAYFIVADFIHFFQRYDLKIKRISLIC